MKRTTLVMLLLTLCGFSSASFALSESEAEDLADLTAVFVYLKMIVVIRSSLTTKLSEPLSTLRSKSLGSPQLR